MPKNRSGHEGAEGKILLGCCWNQTKCTVKVAAGKFLGFMLTSRGIEANLDKCRVVIKIKSPQNLKEVQQLTTKKKEHI